jgi:hypothetical protein
MVRPPCRARTMFVAGVSLGSVVAMRLGDEAVDVVRGWLDRLSGRHNRVNFELLLQ